MIEKQKEKNVEIEKSLPVLREVVSALWSKEDEMKQLTEELATLNRQIQLTLKPVSQYDAEENKVGQEDMLIGERRLVSGSDLVSDYPQGRHVKSQGIISPSRELKKIS